MFIAAQADRPQRRLSTQSTSLGPLLLPSLETKGESKTKTTNKDKEWGPLLRRLEMIQQMGMGTEDKEHRRVNKWRYEFQEVLHKLRTQIQFNRPSMTFPLSISVHPGLYPKLILFHEMSFEVHRLKILWSRELWIIFG